MIGLSEVRETNAMIEKENLDVRTITMGISLLDCIDSDLERLNEKIYDKIYRSARIWWRAGEEISEDYGIPDRQQEDLRDTDRADRRERLQIAGRLCADRADAGQGGARDVGVNFSAVSARWSPKE